MTKKIYAFQWNDGRLAWDFAESRKTIETNWHVDLRGGHGKGVCFVLEAP